jgi:kinesin family protein 2/24
LTNRVKSLSKGGNTKKDQLTVQSVASGKESTYNPLSGEAEENMEQTQETRPLDGSKKGVDNSISNCSMEPERNSFSMIPSYQHRGKDETSSRSGLNDRERGDWKLQDSVNSQENVKITKVSPPWRKANRDDKSEKQSNFVKKESGPEISRTVLKQQQQFKQQQLQRPSSASAPHISSRQSEKEDMEINAILEVIFYLNIIILILNRDVMLSLSYLFFLRLRKKRH